MELNLFGKYDTKVKPSRQLAQNWDVKIKKSKFFAGWIKDIILLLSF